jgi:hypothetical protein
MHKVVRRARLRMNELGDRILMSAQDEDGLKSLDD